MTHRPPTGEKMRKAGFFLLQPWAALRKSPLTQGRGRSSGVERYLAKVNVVSSNLITRSNKIQRLIGIIFPSIDLRSNGVHTNQCDLNLAKTGKAYVRFESWGRGKLLEAGFGSVSYIPELHP